VAEADKKKPGLMVAIGVGPKLKSKGAAPPAGSGEDDMGSGDGADASRDDMEKSAIADFVSAVHASDIEGALAAFKDAYHYCKLADAAGGEEAEGAGPESGGEY